MQFKKTKRSDATDVEGMQRYFQVTWQCGSIWYRTILDTSVPEPGIGSIDTWYWPALRSRLPTITFDYLQLSVASHTNTNHLKLLPQHIVSGKDTVGLHNYNSETAPFQLVLRKRSHTLYIVSW